MKFTYITLLTLSLLFGCNGVNNKAEKADSADENNRTAVNWEGTYEGILPCADCDGIKTIVTLNQDKTYTATDVYLGKSDSIFETTGTFSWSKEGLIISFSDSNRNAYTVEENTLTHLDSENRKISGDLAERYILKKTADVLEGKKWHLVSSEKIDIQLNEAKAEHPFFQFKEDGSLIGFSGCNNFFGRYNISDPQQISFSNVGSTKMLCPEMATENRFMTVLEVVKNYTFKNRALIFYDAEFKQIAMFKIAN